MDNSLLLTPSPSIGPVHPPTAVRRVRVSSAPPSGTRWASPSTGDGVLQASYRRTRPRRAASNQQVARAIRSAALTTAVTFLPAAAITLLVLALALTAGA